MVCVQVQLPERFIIYELLTDDPSDMQYKMKERFSKKIDCFLLILCSNHIVLCLVSMSNIFFLSYCLQHIDAVGWVAGRASGLYKPFCSSSCERLLLETIRILE